MASTFSNNFSMSPVSAKLLTGASAALKKGDNAEAIKLCKKAIRTDAANPHAWYLRAIASANSGLIQEAKDCYKKTLQFGKHPDYFSSAATFYFRMGDLQKAEQYYAMCFKLHPDYVNSLFSLGYICSQTDRLADAINYYKQALAKKPDYVEVLVNLAALYVKVENFTDALPLLQKAHSLLPNALQPKYGLGEVYEKTGQSEQAIEMYKSGQIWGPLARVLRDTATWDDLAKVDEAYINTQAYKNNGDPLSALNMPHVSAEMQRVIAHDHALTSFKNLQRKIVYPEQKYNGKLKIGYLSSDFHRHATMRLFGKVLSLHNPEELDVHIFKHGPIDDESINVFLQGLPLQVHNINALTDLEAAQLINRLGIQILVDLKGYTQHNRLEITALKPAPITLSWLGYPGTLGHRGLADYILGDPIVTPLEHAHHFSEDIVMMPHCYQPNDNDAPNDPPITRQEAGLPEEGFIFCSFNQVSKINSETFAIWCRLLKEVQGSYLWQLEPKSPLAKQNLKRELVKNGVDEKALIFADKKPIREHFKRLKCADMALDTFSYNSHTTASDALWCGVPLVTLIGDCFASRVAASLLTTHGFDNLIAHNYDEYFKIAYHYATNKPELDNLKTRLNDARATSKLYDSKLFAENLTIIYKQLWEKFVNSN